MPEHTHTTPTGSTATREPAHDWAARIAAGDDAATDTPDPTAAGPGAGLRAAAAAMVAAPAAMTAWFLVEAAVLPREEPRVFLQSIADAPTRYVAATLLVGLAGALAVPAALGVARLLRPRVPRLGAVIGLLMFLSGIGLAAQVGFRAFVWAGVSDGTVPDSAVTTYTAFQDSAAFDLLVAPGLVFGGLATVLLVGTLLATRLAPWWVPVGLVLGTVLASGEFPDVVTVSGAAIGAAANLRLAQQLLRSR